MSIPFASRVAYARPMPIGDRQLDQLIQVGIDAQHGNSDEARIEWLISCTPQLLQELRARRAMDMPQPEAEVIRIG